MKPSSNTRAAAIAVLFLTACSSTAAAVPRRPILPFAHGSARAVPTVPRHFLPPPFLRESVLERTRARDLRIAEWRRHHRFWYSPFVGGYLGWYPGPPYGAPPVADVADVADPPPPGPALDGPGVPPADDRIVARTSARPKIIVLRRDMKKPRHLPVVIYGSTPTDSGS